MADWKEIGDTVKSFLEVVTAVITAIVIVYKWIRFAIKKQYDKHFRQHFENADFIVKKWPEAYGTQQELKTQLQDIRHQLFPNNGGSLFDKVTRLQEGQHNIQQAITVNLKLDTTAIAKADKDGSCIFVNAAWLRIAGFNDPQEAYGIGWVRAIYPEDREWLKKEWTEAVETETPFITTFRMQNVQTRQVYQVEVNTSILRTLEGEINEFMSTVIIK